MAYIKRRKGYKRKGVSNGKCTNITLTINTDLRDRMEKVDTVEFVNWSWIARKAFEEKCEEFERKQA